MDEQTEFKPSTIRTDSKWPIGSYYWEVITDQRGMNGYGGIDLCVSGVSLTFRGAKRAIRKREARRDRRREWVIRNG